MRNIIIVGCGRVGSQLALKLSESDNNVCVIDRNPASFSALGRDFNGSTFQGVGYDEEVLVRAGIEECDFVAAVTQSDNANLMVVEIARRLYDVPTPLRASTTAATRGLIFSSASTTSAARRSWPRSCTPRRLRASATTSRRSPITR